MPIVAGADFGTQSVRVAIVDSARGPLGVGVAEYPVIRKRDDPDFATQSHASHMTALVAATRAAVRSAGVDGRDVRAIALDTTGSTVIPVDEHLEPLDDYYLWCDHRAKDEAALITDVAQRTKLPAIEYCGGVYSSEWGFAKLLHWLRHNPDKRARFATALEHCDMVAATLSGVTDARRVARSICAMGHKWLWNDSLGGFPPEEFFLAVDPLLAGIREKLGARDRYRTSDRIGRTSRRGVGGAARRSRQAFRFPSARSTPTGMRSAPASPKATSSMSSARVRASSPSRRTPRAFLVCAASWTVPYARGTSASKQDFRRAVRSSRRLPRAHRRRSTICRARSRRYRAGQTGLLRLTWDTGDRTVLVNPNLGGVTLGWNVSHDARDDLFAAIEGTAFHTRIVLERMAEHGVPIRRVINAGGVSQKNDVLNQVYANVLGKPVLVPERPVTVWARRFSRSWPPAHFETIDDAQRQLCPPHRIVEPDARSRQVYDRLYSVFKMLYFSLGNPESPPVSVGSVLPELRRISADVLRGE